MDLSVLAAFAAATIVLMLTPGPIVAYLTATTMARGLRAGLLGVVGTTLASAVQLLGVALGLSTIMQLSATAFIWLKGVGAAYLIYLAIRAWRAPANSVADQRTIDIPARRTRILAEAFFVSVTSPKAILFHTAFLPAFIAPDRPAAPQLAILAATFLVIAMVSDCLWSLAAGKARAPLRRLGRWLNRVTAGVFLAGAAGLAMARQS